MPSARGNWCEVGAATRVAKYREWIADSIEYLEGKPLEAENEDERKERDEASSISTGYRKTASDAKYGLRFEIKNFYVKDFPQMQIDFAGYLQN